MNLLSLPLSAALAAGTVLCAQAAATCDLPDVPTALQQAKESGKPVLVLWHGSDWLYDDAAVCKGFGTLKGALPLILAQFDDLTGVPNEVREKTLPTGAQFSLPVAILLTADGSFAAKYPAELVRHPEQLKAAAERTLTILPKFTELDRKAREGKGIPAAEAATQALSLLAEDDAMRHRSLRGIINTQDPEDKTGGRAAFGMEHGDMYKQINTLLNGGEKGTKKGAERDFAAALAYVKGVQKRAGMMPKGKQQQWMAGLGFIYKEQWLSAQDEKARLLAAECYRKCAAIDPESEYGKGAMKYVRYTDPKAAIVISDHFYGNGDQTFRFEKDWHVNVSSDIKGPGTYTFRLVPLQDGPLVTRNFRLAVNGKEVGTALGIDAKKNTKEVQFTVPATPADATVEVYLTAQCNDGWFGCSGTVEMVKKP